MVFDYDPQNRIINISMKAYFHYALTAYNQLVKSNQNFGLFGGNDPFLTPQNGVISACMTIWHFHYKQMADDNLPN